MNCMTRSLPGFSCAALTAGDGDRPNEADLGAVGNRHRSTMRHAHPCDARNAQKTREILQAGEEDRLPGRAANSHE
jgi:hypothetical protein